MSPFCQGLSCAFPSIFLSHSVGIVYRIFKCFIRLSVKPQNSPALLGGPVRILSLFYRPLVRLCSATGQLLGFSVFREMEVWFDLIR